jgi:hypothetical protein
MFFLFFFLYNDFFYFWCLSLLICFAAGVVDTGGAPWFANISANFRKMRNGPNGILWGWGETDSWKKPEAKHIVILSLIIAFSKLRSKYWIICIFVSRDTKALTLCGKVVVE